MSKNLIKRVVTSILLLIMLFVVTYSNSLVLLISLLLLSFILLVEFNNIFRKITEPFSSKNHNTLKNLKEINLIFFVLNIIAFLYIFFVFCQYSYDIYKLKGPTFFLFIISICFLSDIGGYVIGKNFGGKKLTKISPNKTISGLIGSFLFSIIALIIFSSLNNFKLEFNLINLMFCLLISLISQLGDLSISYLKRKAKIKDTGKILPGHGGLLDRLDGIIFALPFSYLFANII